MGGDYARKVDGRLREQGHDVVNRLAVIHTGAFSGTANSITAALRERLEVVNFDLLPLARRPRKAAFRLAGLAEARKAGSGIPWSKTGTWSRALQRHLEADGCVGPDQRVLFLQTVGAFVLDERVHYTIYTDRVGLEGAAAGGTFSSRFTPAWAARERTFLRRARHICVMGPSTKQALVEQYRIPEQRVSVVGAGPNAPVIPTARRDRCKRLIFIGTQWELKGGPVLLAAFKRARRAYPDLQLAIVGTEVRGKVPGGVDVVGRVPHWKVGVLLSHSDVVVIPSHMEAFGIALLEGLLTGLPCIGSTVGNQRWIIGDAGLCVPPGDVDALVRAIARVMDNYDLYRSRALRRREVLGVRCNWAAVAERILVSLR